MGEDQQKHDLVLSTLTDGVWNITVDRPEKRNALTIPMFSALAESLRLADAKSSHLGETRTKEVGKERRACISPRFTE